jgi:hypothetical protein
MKATDLNEIRKGSGWTADAIERRRRRMLGLVKIGSDANRAAAAIRHAAMEPVLRELVTLSPQRLAVELSRRGIAQVSYKTIERFRRRLGLPDWFDGMTVSERVTAVKAAAKASRFKLGKPQRRRQIAKKANREIASATE